MEEGRAEDEMKEEEDEQEKVYKGEGKEGVEDEMKEEEYEQEEVSRLKKKRLNKRQRQQRRQQKEQERRQSLLNTLHRCIQEERAKRCQQRH